MESRVEVVNSEVTTIINGPYPLSTRVQFYDLGHALALNSVEIFERVEVSDFH